MKLWIVGAGGLLGAEVHRLCMERRIVSVATTRQQADITHFADLERAAEIIQPTHIINCAAFTRVDDAEKEQELAYRVNARGPGYLGSLACKYQAKIIHISTDYVFPGNGERPYQETDSTEPQNVYGKTKWEGECNLRQENPEACIIRTSWLYGKHGKNFISSLMQLLKTQPELNVVEDQRGRPTYFKDLAEVILELIDHAGIFHFANEGAASRYEIAKTILSHMQSLSLPVTCQRIRPVKSIDFPLPAKRPGYSVLDTTKIEQVLEKKPRHWEETLREYLHYVS